jgi:thiamine biosynthesis lipoprotein
VNLWSFGPDRRPEGIPTDEEIAAAKTVVGFEHLQVRLDPPALRKSVPELEIDLSAIAKGYAVDRVGELLEQGGIAAYMVEVGGEVRTRGRKLDGSAWRIGLEQPIVGKRQLQSVVQLENHCLATSGDYRNGYEWEGEWYSHEIDPETGRPAKYGVASVSVLGPSVMLADAYATAFMVMPAEDSERLAKELGLEIMLLVRRSDGETTNRSTPGFAELLLNMVP